MNACITYRRNIFPQDFLKISEDVKKSLNRIHKCIVQIDGTVDNCLRKLRCTKVKTFHLQDHTSRFITERLDSRQSDIVVILLNGVYSFSATAAAAAAAAAAVARFRVKRPEISCFHTNESL